MSKYAFLSERYLSSAAGWRVEGTLAATERVSILSGPMWVVKLVKPRLPTISSYASLPGYELCDEKKRG